MPKRILVVDVGGSNVKVLATGQLIKRSTPSGPKLTPQQMVERVRDLTADWKYDVVSLGLPGPVVRGRLVAEPANLGKGWMGFNFTEAFGCPVKVINDAAMQALGSYKRGRLLFLGVGTGLGSALVLNGTVEPLELAHLPYRKNRSYEDYVGLRGLKRMGKKRWRKHVLEVVELLRRALVCDDLVVGGGNAKLLQSLPSGARLGGNTHAFKGGFAMWTQEAAKATSS